MLVRIIGGLAVGFTLAQAAVSQSLMTCEVIGSRGSGENVEIIYNQNSCRPVTSAEVVGTLTTGNSSSNVYGSRQQPVAGGGPVYIMRHGNENTERGNAHYGAPLDGNVGTGSR